MGNSCPAWLPFARKDIPDIFMKKWLLFYLLMALCQATGIAQTPPYYKGNGTLSSTIPMNSGASLCQQLYQPSDFNTLPASGLITKIYLRNAAAGASGTYTNFRIAFVQSSLTAFSSTTFIPGTTTAFAANTFSVTGSATAGGWYEIPLTTPFAYDNTQSLIVELSYSAKTGGISGYSTTAGGNKRLASTLSNTAATGTLSASWGDFGMEVVPAIPCLNPPLPGIVSATPPGNICPGTGIYLNLSGNSTGVGQSYEWESSPSEVPFVATSLGTAAATPGFTATITTNTWYRAKVVCGSGAPVYSPAVQVTVNPSFPGGTYTINNALPTGGTNFSSFTEAIAALDCGIAGPVTFEVAPGMPYTETIIIGDIAGTSAVNRINFKGNGATVQFANTAANRQMLRLDGARYVRIDSLTFKTLATDYGWAALLTHGAAWDSISHCTFDLSSISVAASGSSSGICFSASATAPATGGTNGNNCYVGYNRIIGPDSTGGPYYALTLAGASNNNVIAHNELRNFHLYGLYINGAAGTLIRGNDIHRRTKTTLAAFYGIYTSGNIPGTHIIANRIHDPAASGYGAAAGFNGLYLLGGGTPANPCLVYNNVLYNIGSGGTVTGIFLNGTPYTLVYHNSFSLDQALSGTLPGYGIYAGGTNAGLVLKNNNISITGGSGGEKYGFYYQTLSSIADAQHNNFYLSNATAGAQYYGFYAAAFPAQPDFQSAYPALETGSPSLDPQFSNPGQGDLMPGNNGLYGAGENLGPSVPDDVLGNARTLTPTPGAFEIPVNGINNAGVAALVQPSGRFCAGQQPVRVVIYNGGANNINSLQIQWEVNGVPQPPVAYNGLLSPGTAANGTSMDTVTLGTADFASGVSTAIKAWTYHPNSMADMEHLNDTLMTTIQPATFSITATADTICSGSHVALHLFPDGGYTPGQLQWQYSGNGSAWNDIAGADSASCKATGLFADTWYRVNVNGNNGCYSNLLKVSVADPQVLSAPDTVRCGPGQLSLHGEASVNALLKWYAGATAVSPLGTGNTFVTPMLDTGTFAYFVSADLAASQPLPAFAGSGTGTTMGSYSPFYSNNLSQKAQYLVKAAELQALGFHEGLITSLGFDIAASGTAASFEDFTIKLKAGSFNNLNTSWETGMTTVYAAAAYSPAPFAVNQFVLPAPFPWNGTDDLIIETCYQNTVLPSGPAAVVTTSGMNFIAAHYLYSNDPGNCSNPGVGFTAASRPNIQFGMRNSCESPRQEVLALVHPLPEVNLGPDGALCSNEQQEAVLDAGNTGAAFLWDDASVNQTRTIDSSGTYYVRVTNASNCSVSDTIHADLLTAPVVELGSDTNVCGGVQLLLTAGPGANNYQWNTGATSQQLTVSAAGTYSVIVAAANGCTASDTITITMNGMLPAYNDIIVQHTNGLTYSYTVLNPLHVIAYRWDFGDGTAAVTDAAPSHTYAVPGTYTVQLTLFSDCGSVTAWRPANIVDIGQVAAEPAEILLFPNPAREMLYIGSKGAARLQHVSVYNLPGQEMYHAQAGNARSHSIDLTGFMPGFYLVRIETNNGTICRKFRISK
jgi:hypothetical protein